MLDTRHQPVLESLVERLGSEINAKAVMLLHENGQVIQRYGWIGDHEYPAMAALVAAMIATGKSLSALGESFAGAPNRFSCDSEALGLYMSFVSEGIWLAALYDQPMNPGLFRMKVRRYAELIGRIGAQTPGREPAPAPMPTAKAAAAIPARPAFSAAAPAPAPAAFPVASAPGPAAAVTKNGAGGAQSGAASPPPDSSAPTPSENFTEKNGGLFNNITDEEIDRLFDGATS